MGLKKLPNPVGGSPRLGIGLCREARFCVQAESFVTMVFNIPSKDTLPIGVDLGSSAAKLVQLRVLRKGVELSALGSVSIPQHIRKDQFARLDFFSQNIPRVLRAGDFKGSRCVLGLPAEHTFVRHVKVPRLDPKATEAAVRKAAQGELPYPVSEAVIRHIVVGEVYSDGETRQEVIVVAIPLSTMDAYLGMTNRAGLEVVGVNVETVTLVQCFAGLFDWGADPQKAIIYIDLGSISTQVVIAHGTEIVFARNLPRGAEQIEQAIAEGMDISLDEARQMRLDVQREDALQSDCESVYKWVETWLGTMSQNIENCLRYYEAVFRKSGVDRIIFTGGQARDRRLCQALAQRLNQPAQIGNPMKGLQIGEKASAQLGEDKDFSPGLAVAIGLSLGEK